jgi:general L-amino acid transport system substrate-binding protein
VTSGTTTEANLTTFYRSRGWELVDPFISEETATVYSTYESGACDATTSDMSQLAAVRSGFENPDDHVILDETISKEPLTAAVPHGDDAWFDIVKLVLFGLINAEEYGVTMANVEQMKSSDDPRIQNLLGAGADWGYSDLGLEADAIADAIAAVGNYGEVYNRYLGPSGIAFTLPRGLNELWINGGLIYAPDIK